MPDDYPWCDIHWTRQADNDLINSILLWGDLAHRSKNDETTLGALGSNRWDIVDKDMSNRGYTYEKYTCQ